MKEEIRISELLNEIDGSGSDLERHAIRELRALECGFPRLLLEKFREASKWQVKRSCVFYSMRYARSSQDAVQLGLEALGDRAKAVRFRACMLLAFSLDVMVLPILKEVEQKTSDEETLLDIRAAIDAIENQNSDYFVDREHSGNMTFSFHDA